MPIATKNEFKNKKSESLTIAIFKSSIFDIQAV